MVSKSHHKSKSRSNWRKVVERWAQILSLPFSVAIGGWVIQTYLQAATLNKDYVQLAVNILTSDQEDTSLKPWAAEILDYYSEVKLPVTLKEQLSRGITSLPDIPHNFKPRITPFLNQLKSKNENTRKQAALTLGYSGHFNPSEAVPALVLALNDSNAEVRKTAIWSLSTFADIPTAAIPRIVELLHDKDEQVRIKAGHVLARSSSPTAETELRKFTSDILPGLLEEVRKYRGMAAASMLIDRISRFRRFATSAVPDLVSLMDSAPSSESRYEIASALVRIGSEEAYKAALPVLVAELNDPESVQSNHMVVDLLLHIDLPEARLALETWKTKSEDNAAMIDYNAGCSVIRSYDIKKVDPDYFIDEE